MKKIIFLNFLITHSFLISSSYANLAPEIETVIEKIQIIREAAPRRRSIANVTTNEFIKDIHHVDDYLGGVASRMTTKTASAQTRLKVIATLFQQEIVERNLKNRFYYLTKNEPKYSEHKNFVFNRTLRHWNTGKHETEINHLKALYVTKLGAHALTKDPLLCFRIDDLLKIVSSNIKAEDFASLSYFLNPKIFSILFPEGLFEAIAPYSLYVMDCDSISTPLKMGFAYSKMNISKENKFFLNHNDVYTHTFSSPKNDPFTVAVQQFENSVLKRDILDVFDESRVSDEQRDFWELAGFDFWKVGDYIYPKDNQDTMKITAALLAQENTNQLFVNLSNNAYGLKPSFHLSPTRLKYHTSVNNYMLMRYEGAKFSASDLLNHMNIFLRNNPEKIKNKDFAKLTEYLKSFLSFNKMTKNRKDKMDAFRAFLMYFEKGFIELKDEKIIVTEAFQKVATEVCNSEKATFSHLKSLNFFLQPTYSLEEYKDLASPYLPLLNQPIYRDENYFLPSFLARLRGEDQKFNLKQDSFNSLDKFYQSLRHINPEFSVRQNFYNYLVVLSIAKNHLNIGSGFPDPVVKWVQSIDLRSKKSVLGNLKEGKIDLPEDDFTEKLHKFFEDNKLQEVSPLRYPMLHIQPEHSNVLSDSVLTGNKAADKDFFITDLLNQNDDRTILNGISWYEAVFQSIKRYHAKSKDPNDLRIAGTTLPFMVEKLFAEGWSIPKDPA